MPQIILPDPNLPIMGEILGTTRWRMASNEAVRDVLEAEIAGGGRPMQPLNIQPGYGGRGRSHFFWVKHTSGFGRILAVKVWDDLAHTWEDREPFTPTY